jgi:hypothetical protein
MKFCTIPQPNNLFFVYFAAQHLESNILSVNVSMLSFLKREKVSNISQYEKIFSDTINFIHRVYNQKITKASSNGDEDVAYKIIDDFDRLVFAPYTEDTFLLPKVVLDMLNVYDQETTKVNELTSLSKLVEYKEMMENVLLNQGTYKLNNTDKVKFMKTFQKLLSLNSFNMLNNIANNITLHVLSKKIYSNDYYVLLKELEGKEHLHECSYALEYLKIYEKFIN